MAEGVISNLVAKALELLATSAFKEASSWWGARDDLKKLGKSMEMIQARVHDAEKYQEEEGSEAVKLWLRRLKLLLYQADDLFDHILTVDSQKQRRKQNHKVHFSLRSSSPVLNWKISGEIKSIRKQLDAINSDMASLNLPFYNHKEEPQLLMSRFMKNRETTSFVEAEDVIGRENDQDVIIKMLLDPKFDGEKVTIIPIMGFGGLGKTTLAQFVFNDQRVRDHFDLTRWAYVPDKNDLNAVMGKIFNCFTGKNYRDLPLEELQCGIRQSIESKKYLLVLDDIWDETVHRLHDLVNLLKCGKPGSKVIVTTRSDVVARGLGTIEEPYRLGTLTDDQSWNLFERLALKPRQEGSSVSSLSEIGKDIVKMCGNVPLAIKVAGGFLCSRDTPDEWLYVRDAQRAKAQHTIGSDIMPILKLSYDDLPPALKQCFAYCSLFEKGYNFSQTELVHLWMAQGYFEASSRDIGDRYFLELLRRNLFQDPQEDLEANITSCKMHDLVHDLAQHVAGHESMVLGESSSSQITDGLVHVNLGRFEAPPLLFEARMLRSLLSSTRSIQCDRLISRFRSLRVLSLKNSSINKLPDSIGRLVHLRYLNLRNSDITCLPQAITRLENLQTLNLQECDLKKLPRDFTKLPNLRHLAIAKSGLTAMPLGFGKMTSLQELDVFVVGENFGIDSVPALNLMGNLHIKFCKQRNDAVLEAQSANLKASQRLSNLTLDYQELERQEAIPSSSAMNEMLMYLQLPPNLIYLRVGNYNGDKMQCRWLDVLSKLVSIIISKCNNCKVLPHLSQLSHLKNLYLERLYALEYVEDEDDIRVGEACSYATHYFPALENLELIELPQLKGWTRPSKSGGEQRQQRQLLFPHLLHMEVKDCKELVLMPLAPKLESLKVSEGNAFESNLVLHDDIPCKWLVRLSKIVSISISGCNNCTVLPHMSQLPNLKNLYLKRLDALEYVEDEDDTWVGEDCGYAAHCFPALENLELIELPQLKEWTRPSKSGYKRQQQRQHLLFPRLLQMKVRDCYNYTLLPHMNQLPNLKNLYLKRLDALEYVEDEDDIWVGEDCGYAAHHFPALENLELIELPQLKEWTRPSKSGGKRQQLRQHLLFPRLLQMEVRYCYNCTLLPHMSHLPLLKKVYLERLDALEYVEDEDDIWGHGHCGYTSHYFPALEDLDLIELPQLKGWTRPSRSGGKQRQQRQLLFPHLLHMKVKDCKELLLMPLAPKLESLSIYKGNGKLFESNLASPNKEASSSLFTSLKHLHIHGIKDPLSISSKLCKLESVSIRYCEELRSLMIESPSSIRELELSWVNSGFCDILKGDFPFIETLNIWVSSEELEEENTSTYWQGLRSLRSLHLHYMHNLKKLPPGIACLTNLHSLYIGHMKNLIALPNEIGNLSLLQQLEIASMEKLTALPEEIGNLSKLSHLQIDDCPELRVLPVSIQGLTSLQTLVIDECPHLQER